MKRWWIARILVGSSLFMGTVACQKGNGVSPQSTEFSDSHFVIEKTWPEEEPLPAPFVSGSREYKKLSPIEVPEFVVKRGNLQQAGQPLHELECPLSGPFRILDPNLLINVDTERMNFSLTIDSKRGRERLELSGEFRKSDSPWRSELFSTDKKILEERRVQATAICVTAGVCDLIAVNIYYEINGETFCRQVRSGVTDPEILTSGHETDDSATNEDDDPVDEPAPPNELPPERPKVPHVKAPTQALDPEKAKDEVIVMSGPVQMESPSTQNPYRIRTLPSRAKIDTKTPEGVQEEVKVQALGIHDRGHMKNATYLPLSGAGFIRRIALEKGDLAAENDHSAAWGTDRTVEFLTKAGRKLSEAISGFQFVVTNISSRYGGKLPGHASHQTGLDIDLRYYKKEIEKGGYSPFTSKGQLSSDFDLEDNWTMFKEFFNVGKGDVMVAFVDDRIKQAMCKLARTKDEKPDDPTSDSYQTLQAIRHWEKHQNVVHVRLFCPPTAGCGNKLVSLPANNGCAPIKH